MHARHVDRFFLISFLLLLGAGIFIFASASLGLLASKTEKFDNVLFSQFVFGLGGGTALLFLVLRVPISFWKRHAIWIYLFGLLTTLLVFIPGLGMEHGGAKRWIDIGFVSIQPSEFLKFGLVVYLAAWFARYRSRVSSLAYGFWPLIICVTLAGAVLLSEPDTGTFLILAIAAVTMFFVAGAKWRHLLFIIIGGIVLLGVIAFWKPYVMDRIETLIHPDDFQGAGYQIKQSLIAIGTGGIWGRGFGQSIQKFNFLPEPIGDSIFAVAGEELGMIGCVVLIFLYILFLLSGLRIAAKSHDRFSGLLTVGLVILIVVQSFVNIASMLAIGPLTGVPLVFVSHGGTALAFAMAEVGIILNISRMRARA